MKDTNYNGLLWLIGTVIFVKFMYKDTSVIHLLLGLFFILSITWFVFSVIEVYYGFRFYLSNQKWSYFTATQWAGYLASVPLLIFAFILYVNYMK